VVAPLAGSWLLPLLVFVAVGLATVALSMVVEWVAVRSRRKGVARQLERLATEGLESLAPGAGGLFRGSGGADPLWVQKLATRVPHLRDLRYTLEQADLHWSVQSYLMLVIGLGVALGSAVLLGSGRWGFAAAAAVFGSALPYLYVRHRRKKRLRKFEELFPGAVDLLGRAIRAGHPFASGMKMVAEESAEPIASEFRRTFEEQRFGLPLEDTLAALADRVPLVDVRIFVTALMIQREVGGNLAEILDNLSGIIRQRFTLMRQVRVLTAEGRLSMYVLGLLPFGVGGFVFFSNPSYVMTLFTHPIGHFMVGAALVMQVVGWLWMRRITDIEF
jgi:tight adherence protein B